MLHAVNCNISEKLSDVCSCQLGRDALAVLNAKILDVFPQQIDGEPRHASQYGVPYVSIANGLALKVGTARPRSDLSKAIGECIDWFQQQAARGHDVLVWRKKPELAFRRGRPRLYMRCHTMKATDHRATAA